MSSIVKPKIPNNTKPNLVNGIRKPGEKIPKSKYIDDTRKPAEKTPKKDPVEVRSTKIIDFFNRSDKIKTTEIVLLVLTGIFLTTVIGLCIYFYSNKSFIFEEYIRTEGPPGTMPNPDTKHLV